MARALGEVRPHRRPQAGGPGPAARVARRVHRAIAAWRAKATATPQPPRRPLLAELVAAGLLRRKREDVSLDFEDGALSFDDSVAERATAWMESHPRERGARAEAEVWTTYGAHYAAIFQTLCASRRLDAAAEAGRLDAAAKAGKLGIRYMIRARAFDALGTFASKVLAVTKEPALLSAVVVELQAVTDEVPAGEARWMLRANLAGALKNAGRPDQALGLFAQAMAEAEAAERWEHANAIRHNWADALREVGQIEPAKAMFLASAEAARRAGRPRVDVAASEVEALRIDVLRGQAAEALPKIAAILSDVRGWWSKQRAGETVPDAPDREQLARTLVTALDIARSAHLCLKQWEACLRVLDEIDVVLRSMGEDPHRLAGTQFNRHGPLIELGRLGDAKAALEGCLTVFRQVGDAASEAKVLSALAWVCEKLGDGPQAIALERRSLAAAERLPNARDRAASHHNLANYLGPAGQKAEANDHRLAALVYRLVTGLDPRDSLHALGFDLRDAAARGEAFAFPRLDGLLSQPAFAPLRAWLTERRVSAGEAQTVIDDLVSRVRAQALEST